MAPDPDTVDFTEAVAERLLAELDEATYLTSAEYGQVLDGLLTRLQGERDAHRHTTGY